MGVYFYFYNKTKNLTPNGMSFCSKLNTYPDEYIIREFEDVIIRNGWDMTDTIMARPDDFSGEMMFKNGEIFYSKDYYLVNKTNGKEEYNSYEFVGLNLMEVEELKDFFREWIKKLNWSENDVIIAEHYSEYYSSEEFIKYNKGKILYAITVQ